MSQLLTTVQRVRDRMGTTSDLTDTIFSDFISDKQAFVEDQLDRPVTHPSRRILKYGRNPANVLHAVQIPGHTRPHPK